MQDTFVIINVFFRRMTCNGIWLILCLGCLFFPVTDGSGQKQKVIFKDTFRKKLDTNIWRVEMQPVLYSSVQTADGDLVIDSRNGVTVWLIKKLSGNLSIEYDWTVVVDSGRNDRLSDLNQFWMATDPQNPDLFTRDGVFEKYDSLQLYYIGFGGNHNSTTRFRRYSGDGSKPVLAEYSDSFHLLRPNHRYRIRITVDRGKVSYWVDDRKFFEYDDPIPLKEGYFGFRSTWSRHRIGQIVVRSLE